MLWKIVVLALAQFDGRAVRIPSITVLFGIVAFSSIVRFQLDPSGRAVIGFAFIIYGLAYPLLRIMFGLSYPRLPLFAVPCPAAALITAGLLIGSSGMPRCIYIVPLVWAGIGSSAALAFGIRADLALIPSTLLLAVDMLAPNALGVRSNCDSGDTQSNSDRYT